MNTIVLLFMAWCILYVFVRIIYKLCYILSLILPAGDEAFVLFFGNRDPFARFSPMIAVNKATNMGVTVMHGVYSFLRFWFSKRY